MWVLFLSVQFMTSMILERLISSSGTGVLWVSLNSSFHLVVCYFPTAIICLYKTNINVFSYIFGYIGAIQVV